ncbi:MAG: uracil-DNA glycosylase [Urechidicola sp.]
MNIELPEDWNNRLQDEFNKNYFKELVSFVGEEYDEHSCFPPKNKVFSAFNQCSFEDIKVVIIGQDPYHDNGQANGLCFSVADGVKHPPSLKNIFKEIETDLGKQIPESGNLERWARQGVLLLNATLTVRAHEAGSHQKKGWEEFTDAVIQYISDNKQDVIFLLWGGVAKKKGKKINREKHQVLESGHPSPLSANRGYWFGNKHFSKTNELLRDRKIKW